MTTLLIAALLVWGKHFAFSVKPGAGFRMRQAAPPATTFATQGLLPEGALRRRPGVDTTDRMVRPRMIVDASKTSEIQQLQQRLQQLGSRRQTLIEMNHGRRYRFVCELPLRAGSNYSRRFEDVDTEPVAVVRRVVAHVERWMAERGVAETMPRKYR